MGISGKRLLCALLKAPRFHTWSHSTSTTFVAGPSRSSSCLHPTTPTPPDWSATKDSRSRTVELERLSPANDFNEWRDERRQPFPETSRRSLYLGLDPNFHAGQPAPGHALQTTTAQDESKARVSGMAAQAACNLDTAWASIWRIRSRLNENCTPMASSVRGSAPASPNRNRRMVRSRSSSSSRSVFTSPTERARPSHPLATPQRDRRRHLRVRYLCLPVVAPTGTQAL